MSFKEVEEFLNYRFLLSTAKSKRPIIHGKLFIIGLCILDVELRRQIEKNGVLAKLITEMSETINRILTAEGLQRFDEGLSSATRKDHLESVATWADDPVAHGKEDLLGRSAFAR